VEEQWEEVLRVLRGNPGLLREKFGKLGIVSSGGGFRGRIVLGWLEPLLELLAECDIMIDYLAAVSVSAPMLARLSEAAVPGDYRRLFGHMSNMWNGIEKAGPSYVFSFSLKSLVNFLNGKPLLDDNATLRKLVEHFDACKSVASKTRFDVFAVNDVTKLHVAISNRDRRVIERPSLLADAVVGSMSLVPIFQRTTVDSEAHTDGGFVSLEGAVAAGCDTIFVFFPYPRHYRKPPQSDGFISRHLGTLEEAASASATFLRDRDRAEMKYWKMILGLRAEVAALKAELRDAVGDGEKKNWLERIIGRFPVLRKILPEDGSADVAIPTIVELYADDLPETLQLKDFKRGDFMLAHGPAVRQMKKAIAKIVLG